MPTRVAPSGAQQGPDTVVIAGKYRLESELGRGGMGAVYSARHVVTGRRFAVKLLGRELRGDARAEARLLREATLASAIQHPAIVEVYDVGVDRGQAYMVMRLVHGETLSRRLERGALQPAEAIALLLPVIDAVAAAHACGIVHRDLKPDNVMIEREGAGEQPRVLDFGISKLMSSDVRSRITHPGVLIGTPEYMAPEQVRGESNLDARTDIYSLGVMLYEMLTGCVPYEAEECPELLAKIIEGGAPGVRALRPELSAELEAVVARAMAVAPEQRHGDAGELARELAPFAALRTVEPGAPAASPTPDSLSPWTATIPGRRSTPPRVGVYAALGSAAVGLALALALPALRTPQTPPAPSAAAAAGMPGPASDGPAVARAPSPFTAALPAVAVPAAPAAPPLAAVRAPAPRLAAAAAAAETAAERAERRARRARRARSAPPASELALDAGPAHEAAPAVALPSVTSELLDPFR
jgi:serine/threonine-protein kinase